MAKGVHTSPKTAGAENIKTDFIEHNKANSETVRTLKQIKQLNEVRRPYDGLWTEVEFADSIQKFFDFCIEVELEPSQPALIAWLHITRDTLWDWKRDKVRYGYKHDLIMEALNLMELVYFAKLDKYTASSQFKLKTKGFGYVEESKVDITTNGNSISDASEVRDLVSKLGLDKKKK